MKESIHIEVTIHKAMNRLQKLMMQNQLFILLT